MGSFVFDLVEFHLGLGMLQIDPNIDVDKQLFQEEPEQKPAQGEPVAEAKP